MKKSLQHLAPGATISESSKDVIIPGDFRNEFQTSREIPREHLRNILGETPAKILRKTIEESTRLTLKEITGEISEEIA